jgi:uncharacterized BrkB/YihY/UPF0761 family membrane protein
MTRIDQLLARVDRLQRRSAVLAPVYGVVKKFGDDRMGQLVVGLAWYGFVAIYPLLLIAVTVLGFVGGPALGRHLVSTLHQFPVVGSQFNPAHPSRSLHGSVVGLVVGLVGLLYGAQGVMQTAQQAMAQAWNIDRVTTPGFVPRLVRSLAGLLVIGGTFVLDAVAGTFVSGQTSVPAVRVLVLIAMLVVNAAGYVGAFRVLTPSPIGTRSLVPGALLGATGFTLLITVGSELVRHQLKDSSATYGQFGVVIGLVGFLALVAEISLYGAEWNAVLARHLWPRSLTGKEPTRADDQVHADITHQQRSRADQRIGVGFGPEGAAGAAEDAAHDVAANGRRTVPERERPTRPGGG